MISPKCSAINSAAAIQESKLTASSKQPIQPLAPLAAEHDREWLAF
jgi:hypothetical protein